MMREIVSDLGLVAYCGLYCGACKAYLKDRCPGCHDNQKAFWCKVRTCCTDKEYKSCADCTQHPDPNDCRLFNNLISKFFGIVFRSDRAACIEQIHELGLQGHADNMAEHRRQSIRR